MVAWLIANNVASLFQCQPLRRAWQKEVPGHCINYEIFFIGTEVPNLVLDVVVLALPLSAVFRLQMSTAKKVSVGGIFLLGGLSIVIGIVRLVVLVERDFADMTYNTGVCTWATLEPAIEVLSACLPTLAPLLHMRPKLGTSLRYPLQLQKRSRPSASSGKKRYSSSRSKRSTMFEGTDYRVECNASTNPYREFDFDRDQIPLRPTSQTRNADLRGDMLA